LDKQIAQREEAKENPLWVEKWLASVIPRRRRWLTYRKFHRLVAHGQLELLRQAHRDGDFDVAAVHAAINSGDNDLRFWFPLVLAEAACVRNGQSSRELILWLLETFPHANVAAVPWRCCILKRLEKLSMKSQNRRPTTYNNNARYMEYYDDFIEPRLGDRVDAKPTPYELQVCKSVMEERRLTVLEPSINKLMTSE
jgi:hypothetical protein